MKAFERMGRELPYIMVYPDDYRPELQYPLVVMLHGYGADMRDLASLSPAIDPQGYIYACPNAPLPVEIGPNMYGFSWTPPREEATEEDIAKAEKTLDDFFMEVMIEHRAPMGKAALLGFSQGGSMAYRRGLKMPQMFSGLVALSTWLPDDAQEGLPEERSIPIFIGHGTHDRVDISRARDAHRFLTQAGYKAEFHEYPMGHEINQQEINDMIPWLHRVLPPVG